MVELQIPVMSRRERRQDKWRRFLRNWWFKAHIIPQKELDQLTLLGSMLGFEPSKSKHGPKLHFFVYHRPNIRAFITISSVLGIKIELMELISSGTSITQMQIRTNTYQMWTLPTAMNMLAQVKALGASDD